MIVRLPRWIILGGFTLSFIAGYVNAIAVLNAHAVSHMTGLVSQVAIGIAQASYGRVLYLAMTIFSFFMGSVLSGILIRQSTLTMGRRYGLALVIESLLLTGSVPLLNRGWEGGYYLLAMACGLQNAMASTYSGAIVRTTHLTGFINDFGIAVGHLLRGLPIDRLRFVLYGSVSGGFLSGGVLGIWLSARFGFAAFYLPATFLFILGMSYSAHVHYRRYIRPE